MRDDLTTVRTLYRKLLTLYPHAFRAQFGEAMEQTFNDLCRERQREAGRGWVGGVLGLFIETATAIIREHWLQRKEGTTMERLLRNPRSTAILSLLLALPFMVLFTLLLLHIEPNFGPLQPLLTNPDPDQPNVRGTLVVLGLFVLLIGAFTINLLLLFRNRQAGISITTNLINLLVAAATLFYITLFVGGFIVDQYPCWIGVPNCD